MNNFFGFFKKFKNSDKKSLLDSFGINKDMENFSFDIENKYPKCKAYAYSTVSAAFINNSKWQEAKEILSEIVNKICKNQEEITIFIKAFSISASFVNFSIEYMAGENSFDWKTFWTDFEKKIENFSFKLGKNKGIAEFKLNIYEEKRYIKAKAQKSENIVILSSNNLFNKFIGTILEDFNIEYCITDAIEEYEYLKEEFCDIHFLISDKKNINIKEEDRILFLDKESNSVLKDLFEFLSIDSSFELLKEEKEKNKKFDKYYKIYFADIHENIKVLENFIKKREWDKLEKETHKLKSGAYILNEEMLIKNLMNIEKYSKSKNQIEAKKSFFEFRKNIEFLKGRMNDENSIG